MEKPPDWLVGAWWAGEGSTDVKASRLWLLDRPNSHPRGHRSVEHVSHDGPRDHHGDIAGEALTTRSATSVLIEGASAHAPEATV